MEEPRQPLRHEMLTWEDVDKVVDVLLPQLRAIGPFDAIVMITRGGVIPGGLLAEALDIKHLLTAAVDFPAKEQGGIMAWPTFLQFPADDLLENRRVLVVDDVWGSGRTSAAVLERVLGATQHAYTCVFHYNPYRSLFTKKEPNFYGAVTDAHIIYPWESDRGLRGIDLPVPDAN